MRVDLMGRTFGLLTVIRFSKSVRVGVHSTRLYWLCRCKCGNQTEAQGENLKTGNTVSCGCMQGKRIAPIRDPLHCKSAERTAWRAMWARCTYPKAIRYARYGGRGITVCDRWKDFSLFLEDLGPRPSAEYSLDRFPNVDGHYEPGNVRWGTLIQQARNKGDFNVMVPLDGKLVTVAEWAEVTGRDPFRVRSRISRGWSPERAVENVRLFQRA
jgi:hypothetical protein